MPQETGGRRSRSQQELQDPSLVVKASRRIQSATPPDAAISGLGAGLGRGISTGASQLSETVPQERAPVLLAIFVLPVNAQGQPSRFSSHSKGDVTGELEGWIPRSGPGRPGCHPRGPQVHVTGSRIRSTPSLGCSRQSSDKLRKEQGRPTNSALRASG